MTKVKIEIGDSNVLINNEYLGRIEVEFEAGKDDIRVLLDLIFKSSLILKNNGNG